MLLQGALDICGGYLDTLVPCKCLIHGQEGEGKCFIVMLIVLVHEAFLYTFQHFIF